jgi:hypothetical protein
VEGTGAATQAKPSGKSIMWDVDVRYQVYVKVGVRGQKDFKLALIFPVIPNNPSLFAAAGICRRMMQSGSKISFGKDHNAPSYQSSQLGPFNHG